MNKIKRSLTPIAIVMCLVMLQPISAYASGNIITKKETPVKFEEQSVRASSVKTKTADIIGNYSGKKVGTLQISYQTQTIGGRPQFIFDTCSYEISKIGLNVISFSDIEYSNDNIRIILAIRLGPTADVAYVNFTP